jgi:general secretion pathway protein G
VQNTMERLRARRAELNDQGGFTLIELLIVIVILAILAAIVVFAVQNLTSSSAQASCKADFKTVETAVEGYKAQMGGYPNSATNNVNGPQTDTDTGTNAAAPATVASDGFTVTGGELLSGSLVTAQKTTGTVAPAKDANGNATSNIAATAAVGPWLKDVPSNGTHYTITVSNDGKGTVLVVNTANPNGAVSCSAAGIN